MADVFCVKRWIWGVVVVCGCLLSGCGATTSVSGMASQADMGWSPVKVATRDLMPVQGNTCLAVLPESECGQDSRSSVQIREAALDDLADRVFGTEDNERRFKQSRVRFKRDRVEWQYMF